MKEHFHMEITPVGVYWFKMLLLIYRQPLCSLKKLHLWPPFMLPRVIQSAYPSSRELLIGFQYKIKNKRTKKILHHWNIMHFIHSGPFGKKKNKIQSFRGFYALHFRQKIVQLNDKVPSILAINPTKADKQSIYYWKKKKKTGEQSSNTVIKLFWPFSFVTG